MQHMIPSLISKALCERRLETYGRSPLSPFVDKVEGIPHKHHLPSMPTACLTIVSLKHDFLLNTLIEIQLKITLA